MGIPIATNSHSSTPHILRSQPKFSSNLDSPSSILLALKISSNRHRLPTKNTRHCPLQWKIYPLMPYALTRTDRISHLPRMDTHVLPSAIAASLPSPWHGEILAHSQLSSTIHYFHPTAYRRDKSATGLLNAFLQYP
jgi:hypothetical protein